MKATTIEQGRFEPTVVGAVRRYRMMVVIVALLTAAAAVGYSLVKPDVYRAHATITVPPTSMSQGSSEQYFDSQVLLLRSQEVAEQAARIANAELNENVLSVSDFSSERKSLEITPGDGATDDNFGSTIVGVSFTWPSARVAQVGANAVLKAFEVARAAAITAQGEATVAGIEKAIDDARTESQRKALLNQRSEALLNQQVDLARLPTVAWAPEPQVAINGNWKRSGAIGLVVGILLGGGLAYAMASRRRILEDPLDPAAIYDAPLIGEIPAAGASRNRWRWTATASPLPMAAARQSAVAEAFRFTAGAVERIRAAHDNRLAVAFVSTDTGSRRSFVVANLALAAAERGTPVLAVDADSTNGSLTAFLLPGNPPADGFEQVIAGLRPLSECLQLSPLNLRVSVLGSGSAPTERTTGAAYAKAVERIIADAKASFDLVLINCPALLRMADAAALVDRTDAAIVVLGVGEPIRDHITMVERLDLVESEVVGYIYRQARKGPRPPRDRRSRASARVARRTGLPTVVSSTPVASSSASSKSLEMHHADEATGRNYQPWPDDVDREDEDTAGSGREHQPEWHWDARQTSRTRDGTWQWPPWASTAANERENSRSVLRGPRG